MPKPEINVGDWVVYKAMGSAQGGKVWDCLFTKEGSPVFLVEASAYGFKLLKLTEADILNVRKEG